MHGYARFATENPALFQLMFTPGLDFSDPVLAVQAADSYAVLHGIAIGLDWDRAETEGAQTKAEMMLWSFVHGYSMLVLGGMFARNGPTGAKTYPIEEVMPTLGYGPRKP